MEWIKIDDLLPKLKEEVLVVVDGDTITSGTLTEVHNNGFLEWSFTWLDCHGCGCCGTNSDTVTHWAKLPDLPK